MQVRWVKIRHFRRKMRYNSKMVQDRHIVSIKVEYEVVCALLNILGDPLNHLIFAFFVAFHIFVLSKHRDFIFGVQVVGSYPSRWTTNRSLKGRRYVT